MNIEKMYFEEHAMGNTLNSLRVLRDVLANSYNHEIAVLQVDTGQDTSGFLILDNDEKSATFTGDGFSTHPLARGESGRGHRSSMALFSLFAITPGRWGPVCQCRSIMNKINGGGMIAAQKEIHQLFQAMANTLETRDFSKPRDNNPCYPSI